MNKEQLKDQFRNRDRVIRILSKDKFIRLAFIKSTNLSKTAQEKHELDFVSASLLSRLLSSAGLYSSFLKGEERIILEIEGNGPISKLYAEAMQVGEVRGFVNIESDISAEEIRNFRDLIGIGLLQVTKVLYDHPEPIRGIIPIQKGDIASDLVHYFVQSEQIPTAIQLDVKIDDNGKIQESAGIMIQSLPGADVETLKALSEKMSNTESLAELLAKGLNYEEILSHYIDFDYDVIANNQVDFFCRCNKDNFKSKLLTLNVTELKEMKAEGQNELVCLYCNEHYYLDSKDFDELILITQASIN